MAAAEEDEAGCRNSDARFSNRWWIGEAGAVGAVVVEQSRSTVPLLSTVPSWLLPRRPRCTRRRRRARDTSPKTSEFASKVTQAA